MARIQPFTAYRYAPQAGPLENLVTQPYDKISAAMQRRYLSLSPYNLVRIILGERLASDTDSVNVYTRASDHLCQWIDRAVLVREAEPSIYRYTQEFASPDGCERLLRKGFIALGPVENYDKRIVHRHEQTLSGPKKDRLELLRHTSAHFGQIFMLYPDPDLAVERLLDVAAEQVPTVSAEDEYGAVHRLWRISAAEVIAQVQQLMAEKNLLIADGHHRYETALAFRDENPDVPGARHVMMTFVNMHSPGLKILATHRVLHNLANLDTASVLSTTGAVELGSPAAFNDVFKTQAPDRLRIGIALAGTETVYLIDRPRASGELDVQVLHQEILAGILGIDDEAVRSERNIEYVRGIDAAIAKAKNGEAQAAFLLEPTKIEQVAEVAFGGGVMPQKSTDFYPKLLSGLTIYKIDG